MALDNVQGAVDLMESIGSIIKARKTFQEKSNIRVVLTSSMAAIRGTNQIPKNGSFYTHADSNTISVLGKDWFNSYQWSKAEQEKVGLYIM